MATLTGTSLNDTLAGAGDPDLLRGLAGNDSLTGSGGNDTHDGGAGNDSMAGGLGDDIYLLDSLGDSVTEGVGAGFDEVRSSVAIAAAFANVDSYVFTGSKAVSFAGDNGSTKIAGIAGADTLLGDNAGLGGGNDTLIGGAGANSMAGADGDDTYVVDNVKDVVNEFEAGGSDTVESSVSYSLVANGTTLLGSVENLTLTGAAGITGTGNGLDNKIIGNAGANTLAGDGGTDSIDGGKGNDSIDGGDEGDTLLGGAGNDTLDGRTGADDMTGGDGSDHYLVDDGGDTVNEAGGGGTDTVFSAVAANLTLISGFVENLTLTGTGSINGVGNTLKNVITGNVGDNVLDGGSDGGDTMIGGGGNDSYGVDVGDIVTESLSGAAGGTDHVSYFGGGTYVLGANLENLTLGALATGGTGNALDNKLTGNSLDNTLDGKAGKDTMAGAGGNDIYVMDNAGDLITEAADAGTDEVRTTVALTGVIANVENYVFTGGKGVNFAGDGAANAITGTGQKDTLNGGAGGDTLVGGAGADVLSGGNGEVFDWLDGGTGADTMNGGDGSDVYIIDNVGDKASESFADAISGFDKASSSVSYTLGFGIDALLLTGSAALTGTGNELANIIGGNGGANKLLGLAGDDTIGGSGGNDTLDGGTGGDDLVGGTGNDRYLVDSDTDFVDETGGSGIDTVFSSAASFDLESDSIGDVENLTLVAGFGLSGAGNALVNVITGNDAGNFLDGRDGNDTLIGGGGTDGFDGGAGNDKLDGGSGNESMNGGADNDTMTGGADDNSMAGDGGADSLDGGTGNDWMAGGQGNDTVVASSGNDLIYYTSTLDGHDVVVGFDGNAAGGQDVLNLDLLFDGIGAGVATAARAGRVSLVDKGATVEVHIDTDGNGTFDLFAVTLNTADAVTAGQDVILGTL